VRKQETGNSCIEINSDDDNKDDDFKSTPKKRKINIEGVLNEVKEMRRDVKLIFHMSETCQYLQDYTKNYTSHLCVTFACQDQHVLLSFTPDAVIES
jgi:hypothetical protein